jgi:heme exporter protein C
MFNYLANPTRFLKIQAAVQPWLAALTAIVMAYGLYLALFVAPPDYQQGETVRIMFIHVPASTLALGIYVFMAFAHAIGFIFRHPLADAAAKSAAPIGAALTFISLATGSLWGKPMWGAWWVWDARLTSELFLLFLYLGIIALHGAIEDKRTAGRAVSILALVGVVNLPIIHFSVEWWNTLHQGSTVSLMGGSKMDPRMLRPLLIMSFAFKFYYGWVLFLRARNEVLERERNTSWVRELAEGKAS